MARSLKTSAWALLALMAVSAARPTCADEVLRVGSKKFTESVILGEMISQIVRSTGVSAEHRRELGGTEILWQALLRGDIDFYPEYTGTLKNVMLQDAARKSDDDLHAALNKVGIRMSRSLGFNNTYAIGMARKEAQERTIKTISDLSRHPDLRFGFSDEFMNRLDGWPGLRDRYQLPQTDVRGLDHDLAYRGLASGDLHAIDLYSTDAEITYYDLETLEDDLHYFPDYDAVVLYRADLVDRAPQAMSAVLQLEGSITEAEMSAMNGQAKLDRKPESEVAAEFLMAQLGVRVATSRETLGRTLWRLSVEHLTLVSISLGTAILVAIPLGVIAARLPAFGQALLAATGLIQTIPSLALLVFLIPLLGIGSVPAIVALFLYSLLPIIRNTHAGLSDIPLPIRESAEALGLSSLARLRLVELPLASRAILAGIKTAAVINVGTATLGALIGAGGYGQPILTGIRLDDTRLILQGAIPAVLLALAMQGLFEVVERCTVPLGLRLSTKRTDTAANG